MRQQPWWRRVRRYVTLRLFGYVNARDFGMAESNEDNVEELQAAIDYCSKDKIVSVPPGEYHTSEPLLVPGNVHLRSVEELQAAIDTITGQAENGARIKPGGHTSCGELRSTEPYGPDIDERYKEGQEPL